MYQHEIVYVHADGDVLCAWHTCMRLLMQDRISIDIPADAVAEQVIMDAAYAERVNLDAPRNAWGVRIIDASVLPVPPSCDMCARG